MSSTQIAAQDTIILKEEKKRFGESLFRLAMRRLSRDYLTLLALSVFIFMVVMSVGAPITTKLLGISFYDTSNPALMPVGSEGHPFGTDDLGRDYLARLLYGGRISLYVSIATAILSLSIGLSIGVLAGYYQGGRLKIVDDLIMWLITTMNSVPSLFLLIIIATVLAPTVESLILILSLLGWTGIMRLVRGETLSQREREYIVAARAIGASAPRIMFMHIIPNIFSLLIVVLAIDIGGLILVESALSYLGLGVRPPTPSWGNMLSNSQTFFDKGPHLVILPGTLIVVAVLCLYVIGDGLRDAFDPQAQKKG